jgi:ribosomal protein S24E
MQLKVVKERKNPFFKRLDLKLTLVHPGEATPSHQELTKKLASQYKVDPSQVVIDYIFSEKGAARSFAKVRLLREKPAKQIKRKKGEAQTRKAK